MSLHFNDKNIILNYLQIQLKEQYNPNIIIDNKYYENVYNKYGFAHYIAKYLNMMYPPMDDSYNVPYEDDEVFNSTKQLTDCISIMNYFLCDNKGNKLENDYLKEYQYHIDHPEDTDRKYTTDNSIYMKIYSTDVCALFNINDPPLFMTYEDLLIDPNTNIPFINSANRERLLRQISSFNLADVTHIVDMDGIKHIVVDEYGPITKSAKNERIFYLPKWKQNKDICELDEFVLSYLMGRTITPYSSKEDIYYVQKLMITNNVISNADKGIWNSDSGNLTEIIINYQRRKINPYSNSPLFVTGYFDIFTEAAILKDRGEQTYGIHGL